MFSGFRIGPGEDRYAGCIDQVNSSGGYTPVDGAGAVLSSGGVYAEIRYVQFGLDTVGVGIEEDPLP